jgi:succinate-semialdehyde dehydrogenase/glutarate-semialdehyde dehydrogenase
MSKKKAEIRIFILLAVPSTMIQTLALQLNDLSLLHDLAYINGEWVQASSGETFSVVNPADGNVIAILPDMSLVDVDRAVAFADSAFKQFKKTTARERAGLLRRWNELMLENADDLAAILTLENGKSLVEAKGEILFATGFFQWFAAEAERAYGETIPSSNPNTRIFSIRQPIGVVAALVPWNFPAAMVTRKVGAAIAAGCTVVVKPAGETPLIALAIAALAERAGIPKGVLNVMLVGDKNLNAVGKALCESPRVKKVSFTGSVRNCHPQFMWFPALYFPSYITLTRWACRQPLADFS